MTIRNIYKSLNNAATCEALCIGNTTIASQQYL